ncbi:MAG: prolyl oligopeptidase family serine peptidase [Microbacterium sp.]
MTTTSVLTPALWEPAVGVRVRGALSLVGGAGEASRVYERFGRRLSADGYVVAVFEAADAEDAVRWLAAQDSAPRVLVGSDGGAAGVLALAAAGAEADGLIVAGTPVAGVDDSAADDTARTACPLHLGILAEDGARTEVTAAAVSVPDAASLARITAPVLAIHGGADTIAPFAQALATLSAIPELELVETVDGLHDALNDQSHRSVAARIVLWLERLRGAGVRHPIVRDAADTTEVSS